MLAVACFISLFTEELLLVSRHAHLLAARLCELLGLSEMKVAVVHHWGKAKIGGAAAPLWAARCISFWPHRFLC